MGKHFNIVIISKLASLFVPTTPFSWPPRSVCPIVATAVSLLYDIGVLGQIPFFESRLRGAAPTPLALPYPFPTWPRTRTGDKRQAKNWPLFWIVDGVVKLFF